MFPSVVGVVLCVGSNLCSQTQMAGALSPLPRFNVCYLVSCVSCSSVFGWLWNLPLVSVQNILCCTNAQLSVRMLRSVVCTAVVCTVLNETRVTGAVNVVVSKHYRTPHPQSPSSPTTNSQQANKPTNQHEHYNMTLTTL